MRSVAEQLERTEEKPAPRSWEPRVVPGGGAETDNGAGTETGVKPRAGSDKTGNARAGNVRAGNVRAGNGQAGNGQAGNGQAGNVRAGNGQAGNGQAGNGNLPPGWRPRFVGDPDPDSDPDCA